MIDNTKTIVWTKDTHDNSNLNVEIVKNNSNVNICLQGNASTGYSWILHGFKSNALTWTNDNDNLTGEYESPSTLIGQEGRFVFKFTPNKVGTQEMEFNYKRPWEKNKEPVYIARYFVNVVE